MPVAREDVDRAGRELDNAMVDALNRMDAQERLDALSRLGYQPVPEFRIADEDA